MRQWFTSIETFFRLSPGLRVADWVEAASTYLEGETQSYYQSLVARKGCENAGAGSDPYAPPLLLTWQEFKSSMITAYGGLDADYRLASSGINLRRQALSLHISARRWS